MPGTEGQECAEGTPGNAQPGHRLLLRYLPAASNSFVTQLLFLYLVQKCEAIQAKLEGSQS